MRMIDLERLRAMPLQARQNKVTLAQFAQPPHPGQTCADFLASLPHLLAGEDFRKVVQAVVTARQNGRPVMVGMGAHVIKCGLSPIIIDLMRRGIVTAVALNGAGAIHDFEVALVGGTSEDVTSGLRDGMFGMVRETAELMNQATNRVLEHPTLGMGGLLAEQLIAVCAPYQEYSLLVAGRRLDLPVTVHVAIGTDILHMHGSANGAAIGQATFNDFRLFASCVAELSGGIYLNAGSAVIMPEVFLKAFTIAQNLGANLRDLVTVNIDMTHHYRPSVNVVHRPSLVSGQGYTLIGRHEIMIPLLAQAIVDTLEKASYASVADSSAPIREQ